MDSDVSASRAAYRFAAAGAAAVVTAALVYWGTGLSPQWLLTWLLPLPALLLAPRVAAWLAFTVAFVGWGVGGLNMLTYELQQLDVPLPIALVQVLAPALLFGLAVLLFRALTRQRLLGLAAVSVPAVWVSAEYVFSVLTPHGAFWSVAYTQVEVLPVAQVAAIGGMWAITLLLLGVPTAIATVLVPRAADPALASATRNARLWASAPALVLLVVSVGYGTVRLSGPLPDESSRDVALLAAGQRGDWAPVETPRGQEKLDDLVAHLSALPAGTQTAVLAESAIVTTSVTLPRIIQRLRPLAQERHMDIIAGVIVTDDNYDAALIFPSDGGEPRTYRKQHMVPGVEPFQPGDELVFVPDSAATAGVAICKDMDFLDLPRAYRRGGATLMLVPAWDFDRDGWLHARMAVLRGIENGFALVRPAADGKLTASDAFGRIVAEDATASPATVPGEAGYDIITVTARMPVTDVRTLYTRWGDWLAWLSIALATLCVAVAVFRAIRAGRVSAEPPQGAVSANREHEAVLLVPGRPSATGHALRNSFTAAIRRSTAICSLVVFGNARLCSTICTSK